jgi:DNA gyrase subunit A
MGRNTQGVKLIRLKNESDEISSVTKIEKEPEPEEVEVLEGAELTEGVVDTTNAVTEAPEGGEETASEAASEDITEE